MRLESDVIYTEKNNENLKVYFSYWFDYKEFKLYHCKDGFDFKGFTINEDSLDEFLDHLKDYRILKVWVLFNMNVNEVCKKVSIFS